MCYKTSLQRDNVKLYLDWNLLINDKKKINPKVVVVSNRQPKNLSILWLPNAWYSNYWAI